ncbi:MAG: TPM domain-containing protein [Planctomycetota bacterium]
MARPCTFLPIIAALLLCLALPATAGRITVDRPGEREFIRDTVGVLSPGEVRQLHQRCDTLLNDTNAPMFVLTIDAMSNHGGSDMTIETFARTLFDEIGDTHPLNQGHDWSNGILLVVSLHDRAARIELGRTWAGSKDRASRHIMDQHLLPAFRAGDYAAGIVAGVNALDKMARDEAVPARPVARTTVSWWAVFAGLAIFTVVSLLRRGSSGWAWAFWGAVFVVLAAILLRMRKTSDGRWEFDETASSRSHSRRSSVFSGGGGSSSSGSFSGGGGASGRW